MPSIVLLTNRTALSQKPRLMPTGWALLEKGYWPSIVNFWPPLMFSKFVAWLALSRAGPSRSPVGCSVKRGKKPEQRINPQSSSIG